MQIKATDYKPEEVVKMIREWTELTQEQFAKSMHRTRKTVQSWEYGDSYMNLKTFFELTKKHNIEIIIRKK